MKKSSINRLANITSILIGMLMLLPTALSAESSEEQETKLKGKIFGDQLMIFETGRKLTAEDGTYRAS